jgi:D-arabinitol dehydrogenase (NADP+)
MYFPWRDTSRLWMSIKMTRTPQKSLSIRMIRKKMKTMKALVYEKPGRPNGAIREIPVPECGDTQVLIRVESCGICKPAEKSHDQNGSVLGKYPAIPGHEFAGIIEIVGKGVKSFAAGDRVTADNGVPCGKCDFCKAGEFAFCSSFKSMGHSLPGGLAQYVAVEEAKTYHIPDKVPMNGACLTELVGCCIQCVDRSAVRFGDSVLILGAGASGSILSQLFLRSGAAFVITIDCIKSKLDRLSGLGIAGFQVDKDDYSKHEKCIKEKFPLGLNIIVDTTGDVSLIESSFRLLKPGGKFVNYSFPTGTEKYVHLSLAEFIIKELTYIGTTFASHGFQKCLYALEQGYVLPELVITHEFPLDRYFEALDLNLSDKESIKVIIHPNLA